MADKKKNMFSDLTQPEPPTQKPVNTPRKTRKVEVRTQLKELRKMGRPKTFQQETDRLTVDIPITTLIHLKQFLPASKYKTLAHVVDTALMQFFDNEGYKTK